MGRCWQLLASWVLVSALALPAAGGVLCVATPVDIVAFDLTTGAVVSRYGLPTGGSLTGLEWDGSSYLCVSQGSVWETDPVFKNPVNRFSVPAPEPPTTITPRGIVLHDGWLYLNAQVSVGRDTLFALDPVSGVVHSRSAMPDTVTNLQDLTSDGTYLWGMASSPNRLWRIEPATGAFEASTLLPATPMGLAIAFDPAQQVLWWVARDGATHKAYRIDRATGIWDGTTVAVGESLIFGVAAVYRDEVVPNLPRSWGALKDAFRER